MRSLKIALFAGAAIAAAFTSANAADLPPVMQARPIAPVQVEEMTGGWYLRGDIGVGAQNFKEFDFTQTNNAFVWPASWRIDQKEMGDAWFHRRRLRLSVELVAALRCDGRISRQDQVQGDRQLHRVLPGRPLLRRL